MNLRRTAVPGLKAAQYSSPSAGGQLDLLFIIMFGCTSLTCKALAEVLLVAVGKAAVKLTVACSVSGGLCSSLHTTPLA